MEKNKWSTSAWLHPSFRRHPMTYKHLLALHNFSLRWVLNLQFGWNVRPRMVTVLVCGMNKTDFYRKIIFRLRKGISPLLQPKKLEKIWCYNEFNRSSYTLNPKKSLIIIYACQNIKKPLLRAGGSSMNLSHMKSQRFDARSCIQPLFPYWKR